MSAVFTMHENPGYNRNRRPSRMPATTLNPYPLLLHFVSNAAVECAAPFQLVPASFNQRL
jgi:hypothetical protein